MSQKTKIRKMGNFTGVIIPAPILAEASFKPGDKVNVEVVVGKIVLSLAKDGLLLEALLRDSPVECFRVIDEDREWIDA